MITAEELGSRLREARERAGYKQDGAAAALGLDATAIAKIERGKRGVGALELKRLASLYGVSLDYLLDEPEAEGRVPLKLAMRAVESSDPKVEAMERRMERIVSDDRWLREGMQEDWTQWETLGDEIPQNMPDYERGYQAAEFFRERCELGGSPVPDLAMFADEIGVVVARLPLGDAGAPDGCAAIDPQTGAVYLLINSYKPRMRRRFTIAHELGHLAMGHLEGGEILVDENLNDRNSSEREANAFAAGLLMPKSGVQGAVDRLAARISENDAFGRTVWLAASFGVSEPAAAYRLANLEMLPLTDGDIRASVGAMLEDHEHLRSARVRLGLPPASPDKERGVTDVGPSMRARVAQALESGAITVDGAAGMLHIPPEAVYRWIAESGIRLDAFEAPL